MDYKLFQKQKAESIVTQKPQCIGSISFALIFPAHRNPHLTTRMHRGKIRNIDSAHYGIIFTTHNHHAQLTVGKHITLGILHVLLQHIFGVWYRKVSDIPRLRVILHSIHCLQVLRLHGTKAYAFTYKIRRFHSE